MRFDVATNFDNELIDRISKYPVESIYGKLALDIVGGGRPPLILPKVSLDQVKEHAEYAKSHGIQFNYVLNAPCMNNRELINPQEFMDFIESVYDTGIRAFTVSNFNLLRMMRKRYPDAFLAASVYFDIDSLEKIKKFEAMGANELTLDYCFNRNLSLLEQAVNQTKPETKLRLVVNNACLHECPYKSGHAAFLGHSSQSSEDNSKFLTDIFVLKCGLEKILNPTRLITSDWIRPEDVHFYDEIGRGKIVFKLADRARTTEWLANAVKSYAEGKKEGNLFEIINFLGTKGYSKLNSTTILKEVLSSPSRIAQMPLAMKIKRAFTLTEVYVDNIKFKDFLDGMQKWNCRNRVCNDIGWKADAKSNGGCGYCRGYAEKSIIINEEKRKEAAKTAKEIVDGIEKMEIPALL